MMAALQRQLETLRPALLRFAILQLRNEALAEDMAQDTLLAVLKKPEQFARQSSLRTYITGIMKHNMIDALRAWKRERPYP
jgi:RNA polymerase sigma-70 factor (ECF subfamily)